VHAQQSPSRPTAYDMSISAVCVKCKALWLAAGAGAVCVCVCAAQGERVKERSVCSRAQQE
jgi:uncharacterized protein HemX